jgi:NADH:ubiquinone oxidoreductase subunit 2 (subunit N)
MPVDLIARALDTLIFTIAVTIVVFPLVFVMSFFYDALKKNWKKTPEILVMLLMTFIGVLVAVILLEVYLGYTALEVMGLAGSAP